MGLFPWLKRQLRKRVTILPAPQLNSRISAESVAPPTLPLHLVTTPPVQSVEVLLTLLASNSAAERRTAAAGLGRSGEVDASFTPLVTTLRSDRDPEVRAAAAVALGDLGDKRAIPELTAALSDFGEVTTSETVYNWAYEGDPPVEKTRVLYTVATIAREALSSLGVKP